MIKKKIRPISPCEIERVIEFLLTQQQKFPTPDGCREEL